MNTSIKTMRQRITMYTNIRAFFADRNVSEVETPLLSQYGSTDLHIDSFVTTWHTAPEKTLYLHTSPEFAMKRLLASGFGDCFQITKVFRNESDGRNHRPEFSMLEWYRLGFSIHDLMEEVADLVKKIAPQLRDMPVEITSYADAFARIGINPHTASIEQLQKKVTELCGYTPNLDDHSDEWLDFLLVTHIEPHLGMDALTFITDYPASMAALAKKTCDHQGNLVAQRFELYYRGIELANGFDELTDPREQQQRFEDDNQQRKDNNKATVPIDRDFIEALHLGMPECAGVALGLDRLLMIAEGKQHLDEVCVFPAP